MMPQVPNMHGTSSSQGSAAAPTRQHSWLCTLMHVDGEMQRRAQQKQQSGSWPLLQQNSPS